MTWPEVVDQSLCFGWIDSVRYSFDNDSFSQRLTPRRKGSVWSAVNVKRFAELDKEGMVHTKGRAAFAAREEREETRTKRLQELIEHSTKGEKVA